MTDVIGEACALAVTDLKTINIDEAPRIRDMVLADRLGFTDQHMIRRLIQRNRAELESYGEVSVTVTETTAQGGRPGTEYWLLEEQALVICALSRTPAAVSVRRQIITIFMEWRRQQTVALPRAGLAHVRLGDRTVTIDLSAPSQGGDGPWLVTPHGRAMPEIAASVRFDVPGPMTGAGRTAIIPDGPSGRYATVWGRVVEHGAIPTPPAVTDSAGNPLILTEQEIVAALAVRMAAQRQVDAEITRLRRDVAAAITPPLDAALSRPSTTLSGGCAA